jgi:hypothetical protein
VVHAIGGLPLATAMTLNYMSSVWIALFLIGGAVLLAGPSAAAAPARRLVAAVLAGFAGVALVLRPPSRRTSCGTACWAWPRALLAAVAYLQVTALGRAASPASAWSSTSRSPAWCSAGCLRGLDGGFSTMRSGLLLLLAIGALATAAQWMMTRAYATGATLGIAALQYLGIVFASLLGCALRRGAVGCAGMGRHRADRGRRRGRHAAARARPRRAPARSCRPTMPEGGHRAGRALRHRRPPCCPTPLITAA